jgi:hypothetical protein
MENEATLGETQLVDETGIDSQPQEVKVSKLAVASMVFAILGPFSTGALWIVSLSEFLSVGDPTVITLFSCSLAWILGLVLGIKSLEQIESSQGQLLGREYALVGIIVSAIWMILILAALLLPASFSVNS